MLTIEKDNQEYQVKIAVITENYMGHYIYMTPRVYEEPLEKSRIMRISYFP